MSQFESMLIDAIYGFKYMKEMSFQEFVTSPSGIFAILVGVVFLALVVLVLRYIHRFISSIPASDENTNDVNSSDTH